MKTNILQSTRIETFDSTWNAITGCNHNCSYCYAKKMATRFAQLADDYAEAKGQIHEVSSGTYPYLFEPTFYSDKLQQPINSRKPKSVFVCSMGDLFGNFIPNEWIKRVFEAIDNAPQHTYFFLTKNPMRYQQNFIQEFAQTHSNTWWGTTIESTETVDRINYLPKGNANCFISCEPLLDMIDWDLTQYENIKWIFSGAETGRKAVQPKYEWAERLRQDCNRAGVRLFEKDSLKEIVERYRPLMREFWVQI